jgi:hypothetical protein
VSEQRAEVCFPNAIELLDNVDDDLDRIVLWTAALSCFQHPAPEYLPDNVRSDEQGGSVPKLPNEAGDRTAVVIGPLKGAEDESYGRTGIMRRSLFPRRAAFRLGKNELLKGR